MTSGQGDPATAGVVTSGQGGDARAWDLVKLGPAEARATARASRVGVSSPWPSAEGTPPPASGSPVRGPARQAHTGGPLDRSPEAATTRTVFEKDRAIPAEHRPPRAIRRGGAPHQHRGFCCGNGGLTKTTTITPGSQFLNDTTDDQQGRQRGPRSQPTEPTTNDQPGPRAPLSRSGQEQPRSNTTERERVWQRRARSHEREREIWYARGAERAIEQQGLDLTGARGRVRLNDG